MPPDPAPRPADAPTSVWAAVSAEQLLESCPDGFVAIDSGWRITYVNAATLRINGQRREEVLGRHHWELYPAAVGTPLYHGLRRVMEERVPLRFENHYAPWDRWFELDAFPTPDGGIATYYRDVTDRKRAEREQFESVTLYRAIAANLPHGAVFLVDRDLRYRLADGQALRDAGLAPADLLGRSVLEAASEEARRRLCGDYGEALAGRPFRREHSENGRHFVSHGVPVAAADGEPYAALVVSYDVTDRKRAEGLVAGQNRVLELAVGGAPLAEVLAAIARTAETQSEGGVLASVLLLDPDGRRLRHGAAPSLPDEYNRAIDGIAIGPNVGSCGTAAYTGRPVIVADIATDPLWADFRGLALGHGLRACWSTPIRSSAGNVLGTLALYYREPKAPPPGDLEAVALLSRTAALAIERDREARDRVRARAALSESEAKYRTLFESIDEGFCILEVLFDDHGLPADYRYVETNPAFERHTGLTDALGKTARSLIPDHERHWIDGYGKVALTGEPVRFVNHAVGLDRWFDVFAFRIGAPEARRVAVLFKDVTAAKQAEAALRASEARLAEVFRRAPSFMCVLSGPGHVFSLANDRYFELVGRRDLVGRPVREALPEVEGQGFFERLDEVYRTGEPYEGRGVRVRLRRAPGAPAEERFLDFVYQAVRDADGTVTGVFAQGVDITERRRAEEELREANRRKDEFLATLAHELRNPLAPISNALQVWGEVEHQPGEARRLREMMARQLGQLVRLIDDLLDVSRITRGKIVLRKERADLRAIVDSALEGVGPTAEALRHRIELAAPPGPVPLDADPARLVQVFSNILHNACKYGGTDGRISVAVGREGPLATVRIRDQGPGIPKEMLGRIFEMFTQVDRTLDRAQGGLGIGLTLAKTLVELHGGSIDAFSDGPGTGSEFVVRLPAAAEAAAAPATETGNRRSPGGSLPRRRVLVVDDVRPSANTLALMLKSLGQEARAVYDGPQALAAAAEFAPEVVISDIAMPGMDGYELAARLAGSVPPPVLVALTGYGQDADRRRAFAAGFDRHLVKPTSVDALRDLLASLPDTRRMASSLDPD